MGFTRATGIQKRSLALGAVNPGRSFISMVFPSGTILPSQSRAFHVKHWGTPFALQEPLRDGVSIDDTVLDSLSGNESDGRVKPHSFFNNGVDLLAIGDDLLQESVVALVNIHGSLFESLHVQVLAHLDEIRHVELSEDLRHLPNQIPSLLRLVVGVRALDAQHHLRDHPLDEAVDLTRPPRKELPDGAGPQELRGAELLHELPVGVVGSEGEGGIVVRDEVDGRVHFTG
ncbi:Licodione synthase [Senna tora]|uniref:Licodione synthase n=1 Tax=Senna tora TaxID=362788 RepID=A0A834SKR9_9FABA|nr:Licodione synthase [Senna tora]